MNSDLLSMTKEKVLDILKLVKQEAYQQYKADIKGFFGSYARGEQALGSDIDILVEFLPGATLLNLSGLGRFLEQKLNSRVDIVSQRALREEIKDNVYKDLIIL